MNDISRLVTLTLSICQTELNIDTHLTLRHSVRKEESSDFTSEIPLPDVDV